MKSAPDFKETAKKIRLLLLDCDGVLTDAGMYYTAEGDTMKKFSTYDGMGIQLLRKAGIPTAILTGEQSEIVRKRAAKLKIEDLYLGCADKLTAAKEIGKKYGVALTEMAFIGDDVNDFELLSEVGLPACPDNARPLIKGIPGIFCLETRGGEGAVRELTDFILHAKGIVLEDLHQANVQ